MKTTLKIIPILLICLTANIKAETIYTGKTAGLQSQCIVKAGKKYNVISIPFIKPSVINDDIDAIDPNSNSLIDKDTSLATLSTDKDHIIRITSGKMAGEWYLISKKKRLRSDMNTPGKISLDLTQSSNKDLSGISEKDTYTIHPLYDLTELFPEDGSILPSADFDYNAGRIQLISGGKKTTLWLSNGSITHEKGWMKITQNNTNIRIDHYSMLPGIAMIIIHPKPEKTIHISVIGEVLDIPLAKPIYPGKNLLSVEYQMSLANTSGQLAYTLDDLQLIKNGFQSGKTIDGSDTLKVWHKENSAYSERIWLSQDDDIWLTENCMPTSDVCVEPGAGVVVNQ
jgi:hypothetical protein